jgi:hypothetical protein
MSAYKILLNCFLGGCAILIFVGVAKMMKAKTSRGLTVAYSLMGISVVIGIALDVIQAFFLSNADEKRLWIIQRLDAYVVGYYLGLATFLLLCTQFKKKEKNPTQSSEPTRNQPAD